MKTIVLTGDANCGKSTTIKMAYKRLCEEATVVASLKEWGDIGSLDFSSIIEYNGLKVAFYSMGDLSRHIVNAMRDYRAKGVDIMVCTAHLWMTNPFKEMAREDSVRISKTVAQEAHHYEVANLSDAEKIIAEVK